MAHVVAALGLVTAFGHVSVRSGEDRFRITAPGDLGELEPGDTVEVRLTDDDLPKSVPGEAWLHTAIYRARPDVGAVVRAQPPSTFAAASVTDELPLVHGQGAWLGATVPVHPVRRLCRDLESARAAARTLGAGNAVLLRGNGALCVGAHPGLAAARMWLLSVACDIWLSARAVAEPVELDADDISEWSAAGDQLMPRLWRHLARTAATR